ncbi:hypothetical protein [Paenibacillus sp. SAF-068]|uniref:hypothetical protein n=1 Tax=Paenibacillus sp. SAF-068 TaxID=3436864 RepID=UPI0030FD6A62
MTKQKVEQLEKRIEILLDWKDRLTELVGDSLSPYEKWCIEKELSREDQHFITNLCLLFSIQLHPDQEHPDVQKVKHNVMTLFDIKEIEMNFLCFEQFISDYQLKENPIFSWDARELLEKLNESGRSVQLKEVLLN